MFRIKFCRETILKLLYQIDILELDQNKLENLWQEEIFFLKGLNQTEKEFVMRITNKVLQEKEKIDQTISDHLIGWQIKRLAVIDRNLLRMGIGEAYFNDQKAIIIDDVVRIAKKYSDKESYKIINAILDKVLP
jgi:N utilization substance protein B